MELIGQLEEAFHGRIEFLASDGTDPYVPTEETEAPTEETSAPTEEPTEETTVETTLSVTEDTLPPTTAPAEAETTLPETTLPRETEAAENAGSGAAVTVILAAVAMVLCLLGIIVLLFRLRRGGKYLD